MFGDGHSSQPAGGRALQAVSQLLSRDLRNRKNLKKINKSDLKSKALWIYSPLESKEWFKPKQIRDTLKVRLQVTFQRDSLEIM